MKRTVKTASDALKLAAKKGYSVIEDGKPQKVIAVGEERKPSLIDRRGRTEQPTNEQRIIEALSKQAALSEETIRHVGRQLSVQAVQFDAIQKSLHDVLTNRPNPVAVNLVSVSRDGKDRIKSARMEFEFR